MQLRGSGPENVVSNPLAQHQYQVVSAGRRENLASSTSHAGVPVIWEVYLSSLCLLEQVQEAEFILRASVNPFATNGTSIKSFEVACEGCD